MHNKYTHTETQRNDGTVSIPVSAGRQAGEDPLTKHFEHFISGHWTK